MLQIITMTIWKAITILKIKLKKYMKKLQKAREEEANRCGMEKVKNRTKFF